MFDRKSLNVSSSLYLIMLLYYNIYLHILLFPQHLHMLHVFGCIFYFSLLSPIFIFYDFFVLFYLLIYYLHFSEHRPSVNVNLPL